MEKLFPTICPSCQNRLMVKSLVCDNCNTTVSGTFELPALMSLKPEELKFVLDFVKSSGSLKDMAKKMELSYPSVRNMLDDIIEKIIKLDVNSQTV